MITCYHLLTSFLIYIIVLEFPTLNLKKKKKLIELHKQGKTIRQIAPEVRMSFRDISNKIKDYDKKLRLQESKKGEKKKLTKKPSISSQSFMHFKEGKKIDELKFC